MINVGGLIVLRTEDRSLSLNVSLDDDGDVVLDSSAGCDPESIALVLGMTKEAYSPPSSAKPAARKKGKSGSKVSVQAPSGSARKNTSKASS